MPVTIHLESHINVIIYIISSVQQCRVRVHVEVLGRIIFALCGGGWCAKVFGEVGIEKKKLGCRVPQDTLQS